VCHGKIYPGLVATSRLMRETILSTFADQPDIEIVGEVVDDSEIIESVKKTLQILWSSRSTARGKDHAF